jgi:hypothetical protein
MRSWYGRSDAHILHAIACGDLAVDAATGLPTYRGKPAGSPTRDGYLVLSIQRFAGHGWVTVAASRVSWMFFHGPIPAGMVVRSRNGSAWDNRPDNLDLVASPGTSLERIAA